MGDFEWSGFVKFWLWFCLVVNVIAGLLCIRSMLVMPLLGAASLIAEVVVVVGLVMLLFKKKKLGFFFICGAQAASLILCIFIGGFVRSLISAFVSIGILFLAIKDHWGELA